jgi:predicted nucleic acid-binding protein
VVQGKDKGFVATHSLAESYAVLTRLPAPSRVPASIAWQLLENLLGSFSVISPGQKDYEKSLEESARNGVEGGRIYDTLLLAAAAKAGAERIYTFNVSHFQELASEELKKPIVAP